MRAQQEYEPEREEEEDADAEEVVGELAQDQTDEEEVEEEVEEAPDERALELVRRAAVVEVVRDMLAERDVDVAQVAVLTDHEREALEFLQAIVTGRTKAGHFIYAEQRLEQLNLVLADLQPLLAVGLVEGLDDALAEVIDGVETLRRKLDILSEAEDEILEEGAAEEAAGDEADEGDEGDGEAAGAAAPEAAAPEAGTSEPSIKQEKLWKRIFKRGKKPGEPGAPPAEAAKVPGDGGGGGDGDGGGDDRPRKSTVWDPDDQGGA